MDSSSSSRLQQSQQTSESLIFSDHVASSPPSSIRSLKVKKPPPITPKRFTRFFTPRGSSERSGNASSQGKSGRQLRDITANAVNRRAAERHRKSSELFTCGVHDENFETPRPSPNKRRKLVSSPPRSSPIQSSPLKAPPLALVEGEVVGEPQNSRRWESESITEAIYPLAVRKSRVIQKVLYSVLSTLTRSFWTSRAIDRRGSHIQDVQDWQNETANFYSGPGDRHSFAHRAIPFCTLACNTNPLVAIGDEEGGIRLVDTEKSGDDSFSKAHVTFKPHTNAIMDMAFSSNDSLLATASGDQAACIIDMPTQQVTTVMSSHVASVKQVRFQPASNDSVIATAGRDGNIQLWDLRCRGSSKPVHTLHVSFEPQTTSTDGEDASSRELAYARTYNTIIGAHANYRPQPSANPPTPVPSKQGSSSRKGDVSITALQFLQPGREHLLLTASEADACIKLWDIRGKYSHKRGPAVPISVTAPPANHTTNRHYGINSLVLSGDASRLYALCRDSRVYAYSTAHLVLGHAPELSTTVRQKHKYNRTAKEGLGPIYGFSHPKLHTMTFYVKAALRRARNDRTEMLAVGSSGSCAVLLPTDERYFASKLSSREEDIYAHRHDESVLALPALDRAVTASNNAATTTDESPVFEHGTALINGHDKEVTSLTWTSEGELVTIGDDLMARCWREGDRARQLRTEGEGQGRRWGCGWAEVKDGWDDEG